jgi:N-acetylmuramoyl-L-alanine amidase
MAMQRITKLSKFARISLLELGYLFMLCVWVSSSAYGQSNSGNSQLKTVVIDAGHGGKDPGCHGGYSHEKDVCLSMALKLGKLIKEKYPKINVKYTRETDVFIELIERANIANRANADLFICIHANASRNVAYGTETYVLGLHRTESQKKVMERENSIISLEDDKGAKYKDFDLTPDAMIAIQLQQNVNLNNAIKFASALQKEFKSIGRYDRGVKQAGFLVLYKTSMPSVLIETGFLTNPNEESFIGKTDGQDKMAKAMFEAFVKYKKDFEGKDAEGHSGGAETVHVEDNKTPEEKIPDNVPSQELFFSVQIVSSNEALDPSSAKFKGEKVYEYVQDKMFKYYTGIFMKDLEAAKKHKVAMQEKGFSSAFVVAFYQGERISIEKAIKLAEK